MRKEEGSEEINGSQKEPHIIVVSFGNCWRHERDLRLDEVEKGRSGFWRFLHIELEEIGNLKWFPHRQTVR